MLRYKIVETSTVTDEELERIVNRWGEEGYRFEGVQFVVGGASRRPAMAFVLFTREEPDGEDASGPGEAAAGRPSAR